jgi:hypothetical protein
MTIAISVGVLTVIFMTLVLFGHGYVNTCKWLSWRLLSHAQTIEKMHENRRAVMNSRLVHQLGMEMGVDG